ncbi:MAG: GDP-L-fucose synthase [Patescibacteria group bacterium]
MYLLNKKILVTGGGGFLGKNIVQKLLENGVPEQNIFAPRSTELNLIHLEDCQKAVVGQDVIIHAAGITGGITMNREKGGEIFYHNTMMSTQIMEAARLEGVEKFVGIGTVCEYPKFSPIPFREENLWNGYPEETNGPYGISKKMMLVQGQAYRSQYGMNVIHLLQVNLYGPGDHFDSYRSHVIPALILKIDNAKKEHQSFIEVWGTGKASREFLYVEDAAEGIVLATERYNKPEPVNLGSGMEITIRALAELICDIMDYRGELRWDTTKPDGQPRRALDVSKAMSEFGFTASTSFRDGLTKTIQWYDTQH